MVSSALGKCDAESRSSEKTASGLHEERSLAIQSSCKTHLVASGSEMLLRWRASDCRRGSYFGRLADRLQASMQEMPQKMDIHRWNLPRRPESGLRTKCLSKQWRKKSLIRS